MSSGTAADHVKLPPAFLVSGMHAAMFLRDPSLTGMKFVRHVSKLGAWLEKLTGDPQMVPAIDDMPAELPVVVWQSVGGEWECQARRNRIDLHWNLVSPDAKAGSLETFFSEAADTLCSLQSSLDNEATRLAAVIERYCEPNRPAAQYLAEHFCSEVILAQPIKRTENFEINSHKTFDMKFKEHSFTVNSWVRNKSARITSGKEVVLVTCDINTPAKKTDTTPPFTPDRIRVYFEAAAHESRTLMSLYYPGSQCQ
jgi:hypothetical protein